MIGSSASGCHVQLISNDGFDDNWNISRNGSDAVKIIGPLPVGRYMYDAYTFDWEENEEYIPSLCLQDHFIFMRIHLQLLTQLLTQLLVVVLVLQTVSINIVVICIRSFSQLTHLFG